MFQETQYQKINLNLFEGNPCHYISLFVMDLSFSSCFVHSSDKISQPSTIEYIKINDRGTKPFRALPAVSHLDVLVWLEGIGPPSEVTDRLLFHQLSSQ